VLYTYIYVCVCVCVCNNTNIIILHRRHDFPPPDPKNHRGGLLTIKQSSWTILSLYHNITSYNNNDIIIIMADHPGREIMVIFYDSLAVCHVVLL
jgi:hypothetical protein